LFKVGKFYTRNDINAQLGGNKQAYLPTVAGIVVAVCVTRQLNPRAPKVILCGKGPIITSSGAALSKQISPLPVFVKRKVNEWEYMGKLSVKSACSKGVRFNSLVSGSGRHPSDISLVIEMI
jgi:hypothetical protein